MKINYKIADKLKIGDKVIVTKEYKNNQATVGTIGYIDKIGTMRNPTLGYFITWPECKPIKQNLKGIPISYCLQVKKLENENKL